MPQGTTNELIPLPILLLALFANMTHRPTDFNATNPRCTHFPPQMSIQAGRVWPALPSKEDYKFEPNDPAKVAHDYRLLAREIACGRKDGTWPSSYRIPQKPWTPDGEVIAFEAVQVVLADLHHSVAVVHAGKIFAQSSPGHLFYCELAPFYERGQTVDGFDKERVDVVGACDCDGDGD